MPVRIVRSPEHASPPLRERGRDRVRALCASRIPTFPRMRGKEQGDWLALRNYVPDR